ncbi:30S ribosomal protein S20 [Bacteroidota bacterium]
MAHHQSAKKRIRSNERRRVRNQASTSKTNTLTKKVLGTTDPEHASKLLVEVVSHIDKTVSKGRLHKNTAARKKSTLSKHVNKLAPKKEN